MVDVKGVVKRFADTTVLDGINLTVETGAIVAVMGSSGGGKTTLLRCISGLAPPTKGEILVDGIDVVQMPEEARRRMGMVFQSAALFDSMTVYDNVLFGVRRMRKLTKKAERDVVERALGKVGLQGNEGKMPAELSGGMRKRVGFARAVALEPKLMLYDEPTTGLDPVTTFTIDTLIVELAKEMGMTCLVVSHDLNSVLRIASQISFLDGGRLIFDGAPGDFMQSDLPPIREIIQKSQSQTLSPA